MAEKTRYSDAELEEFRAIILEKLEKAKNGICRETCKLIPKERLRAVPHATLSIEAKQGGAK